MENRDIVDICNKKKGTNPIICIMISYHYHELYMSYTNYSYKIVWKCLLYLFLFIIMNNDKISRLLNCQIFLFSIIPIKSILKIRNQQTKAKERKNK